MCVQTYILVFTNALCMWKHAFLFVRTPCWRNIIHVRFCTHHVQLKPAIDVPTRHMFVQTQKTSFERNTWSFWAKHVFFIFSFSCLERDVYLAKNTEICGIYQLFVFSSMCDLWSILYDCMKTWEVMKTNSIGNLVSLRFLPNLSFGVARLCVLYAPCIVLKPYSCVSPFPKNV